jgi:hypothetical protein
MTDLSTRLVTGLGSALERRFSRRSLLGRTAVVGAAVAVGGLDFVLRPTPAYASVCGSGASCGDGWTAMCCTINGGVNQCPAGSFVGGWWKADSASLCGGSSRYYIDCQGECTHCGCGSGSNFCADDCWNCTQHCASGTCDERRVCWNVFRYGQCNQQIGCSGPVLCRMISCVPPWQFEDCTTDAATDDNTTDHSAPCLSPWSAIQARYAALGGAGSQLGAEIDAEYAVPGGTAQNTLLGRLFDSSADGAHWLRLLLVTPFDAGGGPAALGLPTTDETETSDHRAFYADLSNNASVYASPYGAWVVSGAIRTRWVSLGREDSVLGYPAGVATAITGGAQQSFEHGLMVSTAAGAFPIVPPVLASYESDTAELGPPSAIATVSGGVTSQQFTGGQVWSATATGTHAVFGPVYDKWLAAGGATGHWGLPVGDITVDWAVQWCDFQGGRLYSYQHGS